MSEEQNALDELFRRSLEGAELPAPPGVWEGVAAGIGSGTAAGAAAASSGWLGAAWIKAAVAILALGGTAALGTWILSEEKQSPASKTTTINENPAAQEEPGADTEKQASLPEKAAVSVNAGAPASRNNMHSGSPAEPTQPTDHTAHKNHSQPSQQDYPPIGAFVNEGSRVIKPGAQQVPAAPADPCAGLAEVGIVYQEVQPGVVEFSTGEGNWQQVRWVFGDGREATGQVQKHTFLTGKRFRVQVEMLDAAGCARRGEKEIVLNGSELEGNILIPNVFTPNADGINDPYRVLIVGQEKYRLSIYDRAGKALYTGTDPEQGWDGTINGQPAQMGPYIARVEWQFYGHEPQSKTVVIMLKR